MTSNCIVSLRINANPKWVPNIGCVSNYKKFAYYTPDYVNKLYNMVRLQTDAPFFCFTDDANGLDKNIEVIDLDVSEYLSWENWWPAWCKILMFNTLDSFERKIFFHLDTIIHGDISSLFSINENFSLVYSKWRGSIHRMKNPTKSMYNSSCIVWKDNKWLYDYWMKDPKTFVARYNGTDDFYHGEKIERSKLPPIFYSYREGSQSQHQNYFKMMDDHSVALMHQDPKNHVLPIDEHPIISYWK